MKTHLKFLLVFVFSCFMSFSQNSGKVKGKVIDANSRLPISLVSVIVTNTNLGAITNDQGEFEINNVPLGYVNLIASSLGYSSSVTNDYLVTLEKVPFVTIVLSESNEQLKEVVIEGKLFKTSIKNPVSYRTLGLSEIEKNPGGNRDILKVIQSLPGVASNPGFRNDIIIRGGSPSENKFYLDGVEVPVINHFQTQGSSGGPVGIINADLIQNVDFYTSAFPLNNANALSSVISFTQKDGNSTNFNARATIGTSDAGLTFEGPLSSKTNFIASVRQSYLQFLFKLIKLPFLPTYNDFQFKVNHSIDSNNEISVIGLGAIDKFKLNKEVNSDVTDEETLKRNEYILNNIPIQNQWNYTTGIVYKNYGVKGTKQFVFSRSEWNNEAEKYFENIENPQNLLLKYSSKEMENKFRFENNRKGKNNVLSNIGFGVENAVYTNRTFQKEIVSNTVFLTDFNSKLSLFKYNLFGQFSKKYVNSKLGLSAGFRVEGVNYNAEMKNPLNQLSYSFSSGYEISEKLNFNLSLGKYHQLPSYTILGFRNNQNELVNKQNNLKYISTNHYVTGVDYSLATNTKISVEGFYKKYNSYPFSIKNQISLANLGSDFGVVGNEEVTSTSKGRAYGIEVLAQKKSYSGLFGIVAYTFVKSEFKGISGSYSPSSWDNKHLLTATVGSKLKSNWEIGGKFRLVGGQPFTPYNYSASELVENYNVSNRGILDYSLLNTERFNTYHQLDVRVDKTWYWKTLSINLYFDIQNVYGKKSENQSYLIPLVNQNGERITNPEDSSKYVLEEVENSSGTVLPRFGVIVDF